MRTFKLTLGIDVKVVVPEQFTQLMREQAKADDASEFQKHAQEMFPHDDEEFTLHILKHGMRREVRGCLVQLFTESGIGCTLSPARAAIIDRSPPVGVVPVLASEIDHVLCAGSDPFDFTEQ